MLQEGDVTNFSDACSLVGISQASLDDLNSKLQMSINGIQFCIVRPRSRCIITTINQVTGEIKSAEPLRTLASYRKNGSRVLFGQGIIHNEVGVLRVGDLVYPS